MELDKIKDKIRKLLALQKGAEDIDSIEEAANAAAQIQKLLFKYNLELSQIEDKDESNIGHNDYDLKERHGYNKTQGQWLLTLYTVISKYNMCKVIYMKSQSEPSRPVTKVFGEQHNVQVVLDLCLGLVGQIKALEKKRWKEVEFVEINRAAFRRAYFMGCVMGIAERLKEEKEEAERQWNGMTDLMVVNDEALAIRVTEVLGETKTSANRKLSNNRGKEMGYEDGKEMRAKRGVTHKDLEKLD